jgi:coenzyme PQQ synthesis protein D (PqqD)
MARLSRHPDVVHTELEDGAVLLHLGTRFYYSLNEAGRVIWSLLESSDDPAEIASQLQDRYQLTQDRASAAVSRLLSQLEREQLIVPSPDGGTGDRGRVSGLPAAERTDVARATAKAAAFGEPELIKHDEPLHEVVMNPFDPQLPLAE